MEMRRELGGRELRLKYTFNSICAVEERAGMPMDRLVTQRFMAARLLFWGALIDQQPEMTLREAGDIVGAFIASGGDVEEILELCVEALSRAGFLGGKEDA